MVMNSDGGAIPVVDDPSELLEAELERLQLERELWERQCREDAHRLQDEGVMLQDAWQRLEEEQRRVLAEREMARRGVAPGIAGRTPTPSGSGKRAGFAANAESQVRATRRATTKWLGRKFNACAAKCSRTSVRDRKSQPQQSGTCSN